MSSISQFIDMLTAQVHPSAATRLSYSTVAHLKGGKLVIAAAHFWQHKSIRQRINCECETTCEGMQSAAERLSSFTPHAQRYAWPLCR
jgi:hypothetical protein